MAAAQAGISSGICTVRDSSINDLQVVHCTVIDYHLREAVAAAVPLTSNVCKASRPSGLSHNSRQQADSLQCLW